MFNYIPTGSKAFIPINEYSEVTYVRSNNQNTPLEISVWDDGVHHVEMQLGYDVVYFNEKEIELMTARFEYLLMVLRDKPDQLVSEVSILSESEIHQQLVQWNDTAADYPIDKCIHELFEAQVEQTPDAIAVSLKTRRLAIAN